MKTCLAKPNSNIDKFTIVVNVKESGQFADIDFELKSNTAKSFSEALHYCMYLPQNYVNVGHCQLFWQ